MHMQHCRMGCSVMCIGSPTSTTMSAAAAGACCCCCHQCRAERQTLLQHLKEQLVGGFADALQGDIAALDSLNTQLRQLYDANSLQVRCKPAGQTEHSVCRPQLSTQHNAAQPASSVKAVVGCTSACSTDGLLAGCCRHSKLQDVSQRMYLCTHVLADVCASVSPQTLRCARVVGMTTSGVARMQNLVEALQPKVGHCRIV